MCFFDPNVSTSQRLNRAFSPAEARPDDWQSGGRLKRHGLHAPSGGRPVVVDVEAGVINNASCNCHYWYTVYIIYTPTYMDTVQQKNEL
jgi:hypothetical protein